MKFTKQDLKDLKFNQVLTQNDKMRKTSKENNIRLYNFGITALKSLTTNKSTCPFAGECAKFCYAQKGSFVWTNTKKAYEKRYLLTKEPVLFKSKLTEAIKRRKASHIRIHDSGDFYNLNYINQWIEIINDFQKVTFYAYTKSKVLFDKFENLPKNLILIYSLGSKKDDLINQSKERHAKIFLDEKELIKSGYVNASKNDLLAIGQNKNIGLLIH